MKFLRSTLFLVFSATMLEAGAATQTEQNARKPNVILIMADDVSWECFGAYGAEDYKTPHIDALAKRGVRFKNCYSTPLCTPSRVKLMTGKYNFRNYTHFGYLNPKEKTFGQMMQAAGYKTAIAGKWQLNGIYHGVEGKDDNTRPFKAGFDEYCLWQLTRGARVKDGGGERFWSPLLEQNGKFLSIEANHGKYGPDITSDFVCDFIDKNRDQPFFVYYPTTLVHNPFVPTPDTIGSAPRNHDANKSPKSKKERKANFVAMVNYLDKIVGKIVKQVEQAGQLENTLILFTADNGTNVGINSRWKGQNIQGGKGSTTDMGTHVPLVAYWKGHTPQGVVLDDLIDFTDFYSTFAAMAGVKLGKDDPIDGRSFLPQLNGKKGHPREWVFCHYQPYWGRFKGSQYIRDGQFKLYRDGRFFNVPQDLKESRNLTVDLSGERGKNARLKLEQTLKTVPPAPAIEGGRNIKERPVYPDWKNILDPND
ncbi:MAG: sulfatase-like hydrolase/transferase [Planctomycetes bacterium]|nr:sulfatase-like hydrolase/transferase [Planctomycetota bacterium]MCH9725696.1 sulfatase-like hydrolase/transferase [Planctomycetota bacterium]MCH9777751.1 sulfatase-like hydrolase/transferase [Planctomycetota bacterium]MCH9791203.1 sulfatase-like hydrolase/transferase [Planctomycetota bacterium]